MANSALEMETATTARSHDANRRRAGKRIVNHQSSRDFFIFPEPCKQHWHKCDQAIDRAGKSAYNPSRNFPFSNAKMKVFMKSRIENRNPDLLNALIMKVDSALAAKRMDAMLKWDTIPDEGSISAIHSNSAERGNMT
jgi:hypothetical protein